MTCFFQLNGKVHFLLFYAIVAYNVFALTGDSAKAADRQVTQGKVLLKSVAAFASSPVR